MNIHSHCSDPLQFDFSTAEGYELAEILEHLLFEAEPSTDTGTLEAIHQRLYDEVCLAQWKRENVSLELTVSELVALNQALHQAGGSTLANKFRLTGELRCCLIATPAVDRAY
jgi:hypothetical protein